MVKVVRGLDGVSGHAASGNVHDRLARPGLSGDARRKDPFKAREPRPDAGPISKSEGITTYA